VNAKTTKAKIDKWGIKHAWFAEQLGISKSKLSLWFKGDRDLTIAEELKAKRIIEGLGKVPA